MLKFYYTLLIAILVSFQLKDSNAQTPIIYAEDINFPTISIGGSCGWLPPISETLTIYNYGNDSLEVTKFTFMDSIDFSLTSYEKEIPDVTFPFTVQPMDSINITVFINPYSFCNSNGVGKLKIENNSPQNKYVINLYALVLELEENSQSPSSFSLGQNYPNPFNPSTEINYHLPPNTLGKLTIFNIEGKIVNNFNLIESIGKLTWNGTNEFGKEVSNGVYFYKLETGNFSQTKKMIFLK
ncbi:MAG: T9SS C-terminal target domain-containing protein [Calditrichaeota bacterium]|nr:MAG: T9SS C-terminal target domain-containing protein [Calditrichota bacterium]